MKTLLRALLVAVLLPVGLSLVLSLPAGLLDPYERPLLLAATFAVGLVADAIAFALIRQRMLGQRRLLHFVCVGLLSLATLYTLASSDWAAERLAKTAAAASAAAVVARMPAVSLATSWPFLLAAVVAFIGYLAISVAIPPQHGPPREMLDQLEAEEQRLGWIQQTRWKHLFAPQSLMATTEKLLRYEPTLLPWVSTSAAYAYGNISAMRTQRGLVFSTLQVVSEQLKGGDFEIRDLPRRECEAFVKRAMAEVDKRKIDSASAVHS